MRLDFGSRLLGQVEGVHVEFAVTRGTFEMRQATDAGGFQAMHIRGRADPVYETLEKMFAIRILPP
jgi:hypothetical protein